MKESNIGQEDIEIGNAYLPQSDANRARHRMKIGLIVVLIVVVSFCVYGIICSIFGSPGIGAIALFIGAIVFFIGTRIVWYGAILGTKTTNNGILVKYKNRDEIIPWGDINNITVEKYQDVKCLVVRRKNDTKQMLRVDDGMENVIIKEFEALKQK